MTAPAHRRALIGAAALLLVPAQGAAQMATTAILVGPWPQVQADAALAQRLARTAIAADDAHTLRDVADILDPRGDPDTVATLRHAEQDFRKGFVALSNEAYKQAELHLAKTVDQLFSAGAAAEPDAIVRAAQLAGAAAIRRRRYREGIRWFRQAVVMAPQAGLTSKGTDATLADLYERVRRDTTGTSPTQLRVTSRPAGAAVFLDGRFAGVTPAVVSVPLPGRHLLRVQRDGYLRWGGPVEVLPGPAEDVVVQLQPTKQLDNFQKRLAAALPIIDHDRADARAPVRGLASLLNLDALVLARVEPRDEGRVAIIACEFDVAGDQVVRRASRAFLNRSADFPTEVQTFFAEMLAGHAGLDPGVAALPPPPPLPEDGVVAVEEPDELEDDAPAAPIPPGFVKKEPVAGRWWFWAGIGVLAAGGAAAATVALLPEPAPKQPNTGDLLFQF